MLTHWILNMYIYKIYMYCHWTHLISTITEYIWKNIIIIITIIIKIVSIGDYYLQYNRHSYFKFNWYLLLITWYYHYNHTICTLIILLFGRNKCLLFNKKKKKKYIKFLLILKILKRTSNLFNKNLQLIFFYRIKIKNKKKEEINKVIQVFTHHRRKIR